MSNFQIIFLSILLLLAIVGVATFAFVKSQSGPELSEIVIWGTVPAKSFDPFSVQVAKDQGLELKVKYVEKNEDTFDTDLAEALASGTGPDIFLLPQDKILRHKEKLLPIPFTSFSARDFKDTFIQESELYLTPTGILAMPFAVDPLVMYWNRDIFVNAGIPTPPKTWTKLVPLIKLITKKDAASFISQGGVALGEYRNVSHAKEILSALLLQSGEKIVDASGVRPVSILGERQGDRPSLAADVLRFYTQFSNPKNEAYSWNRSLPVSLQAFASRNLALYFGFASELPVIRTKNSNLNFDVAALPQTENTGTSITFGKMYALATLKQSAHAADALTVVSLLTSKQAEGTLYDFLGLAPVRLDVLGTPPDDSESPIFFLSALRSRAWLDPNTKETDTTFSNMVEDVSSGRREPGDSVDRARNEISTMFQ